MRVNAISGWQRAMGCAAINAQPRRIVDPGGEMSIGRRSIPTGTRQIVHVIAKTFGKTFFIKGFSYHIDDLAA